ncbi:MAG: stage III sporulation protein AB [Clostridia bacterium]|nr:stage III sporulation protein AB [Clostridia bacterium]
MIILKFIICISIILICTYFGIEKAKTYEGRVLELKKIKSGFVFFKSKIEFTYEPIKDILEDISNSIYQNEENIFSRTKNNIKQQNVNIAWNNAIDEEFKINKEDKDILKMFGKLLGKTDKKGQISEIDLSLNFVDKQIQKAELEKSKNSKLFKSLGVLTGIGITIILW